MNDEAVQFDQVSEPKRSKQRFIEKLLLNNGSKAQISTIAREAESEFSIDEIE